MAYLSSHYVNRLSLKNQFLLPPSCTLRWVILTDTDRYVEKVEKSTHIYNMPLLNMMALHRLVVELHTSLDSASSHFSEPLAW